LALLATGYVLLGATWLFSTPPFQAPDEPAHYLRALTLSEGRLLGPREPVDAYGRLMLRIGGWHAAQQRWIDHDRRGVVVAAALSPPGVMCLDGRADATGRCTEITYTGDYSPLAYVLPAAAMSGASHATTALWLGRAASLIVALAWLVVALVLAGPGLGWNVIGVVASATPTMLFVTSVLNPSGLELAASLAFISALARLRRDGPGLARWAWWALILSGATTILAWPLGALFAVAAVLVFAGLLGGDGIRELAGRGGQMPATAALILVAAVGLSLIYGDASGSLHSSLSFTPLGASLKLGLRQLGLTLRGAVGVFGSLKVPLPTAMLAVWWAFVAGLLAAALWVGRTRERVVLVLTTLAALAFPVVFFAFSYRLSGFGLQGRYVMPILVLIPMASCSVLSRRAPRAAPDPLIVALLAGVGLFQLIAWRIDARHWSVASSANSFTAWTPPTTWGPLFGACVLATVAFVAAAVIPRRRRA
jgi:hypothetical protein